MVMWLTNRHLILKVLEAGKSKIKLSALAPGALFGAFMGEKRALSLLFPIKLPVLSG